MSHEEITAGMSRDAVKQAVYDWKRSTQRTKVCECCGKLFKNLRKYKNLKPCYLCFKKLNKADKEKANKMPWKGAS